jgi:predicted phage tail component-like protein
MLADGYDLANIGFKLREPTGLGGLAYDLPIAHVPGRDDSVTIGEPEPKARTLTVVGSISVATMADLATLYSRVDELRWRLERESVQLIFPDHTDRYYTATLLNPDEIRIPPAFNQRMRELRLQFLCPDPRAYATTETTVAFGATAVQMPLGNAKAYPVITLTSPPDTLDIIAKNAAGTEVARLGLVDLAGATTVTIDNRWQIITVDGAAAPAKLVGTTDFFALSPLWATSLSGPWGTLETSVAATASATYRKAWR